MSEKYHPVIRLNRGDEKRLLEGYPWIFVDSFTQTMELMECPPGTLVDIRTYRDEHLGTGYFNPRSQIACRVLARGKAAIDEAFFHARFAAALKKREAVLKTPFYRLVHSESDYLPGLIVDRFDTTLVCQVATAGMELLQPVWMQALVNLINPETVILRGDVPARSQEGLREEVRLWHKSSGASPVDGFEPLAPAITLPLMQVREYETLFLADLLRGQKTGWFYDQRDNRKLVAAHAKGKTVLDVYCHSGGFGIPAALGGAAQVTFLDSSGPALVMARKAAALNGVEGRCDAIEAPAFDGLLALIAQEKRYDIVIADPPAFIPSKKHVGSGLKGYEKVAKLAGALVEHGGLLFMASCSHHATRVLFRKAVLAGVKKTGGKATVLKETGAAFDHPVHPLLTQSEYLKGILLRIG